jgi:hypothetical protein
MSIGEDARPDARPASAGTLRLRAATRALRLHLDELPVDYCETVPPDRFLTGLAFMFARNRYACAESMIGSGFGGTVIGAIARSILTEGLRWIWVAQAPAARRRCFLGDLLAERSRVATLLDPNCPTLIRWLMPIPPVADLTGASRTWLDASSIPDENTLLNELFSGVATALEEALDDELAELLNQAHGMLDIAGLRGAAMVLAHAGHGNYLGQRSTLTEDGALGFDVRADHEALFMHTAAVGAYCVLIGSVVAAPDIWPTDVDRADFLATASVLTTEVAAAATAIHGLAANTKPGGRTPRPSRAQPPSLLHGLAVVQNEQVEADYLDIEDRLSLTFQLFENYVSIVKESPEIANLPSDGVALHTFLTYGAALSNLETVHTTYDQPGGRLMAVFAGRAVLEEAARLHWRYAVSGEEELKARAKQYFDEYRHRQRKTVRTLAGYGIKKSVALKLFEFPSNVVVPPGVDAIAKNREPIPTVAAMLRSFSEQHEEPRWLEAAYTLLSQAIHPTPLGYLHCLRYVDEAWLPNELSSEMLALTLDVASRGSAHCVSIAGLMLNDLSPAAKKNVAKLRAAAHAVHLAARRIHGLDVPDGA